jgi:hypothetical protein
MAKTYNTNYDPQKDAGTSGVEVTDLNPEDAYGVDLRRVDPEQRENFNVEDKKANVSKFMKAAKAAERHKQKIGIDEPSVRGKTPVGKASIEGVELPSLRGRNYGPPGAGATEYAHKPKPNFGRPFV